MKGRMVLVNSVNYIYVTATRMHQNSQFDASYKNFLENVNWWQSAKYSILPHTHTHTHTQKHHTVIYILSLELKLT